MLRTLLIGGAVLVAIALILASCGTSSQLQDLGERAGCGDVRETGKVDMRGTGVAAFCDEILEGKTALIFAFTSKGARDKFFDEVWFETEFAGAFVLVGDDWAVAIDADIETAADLMDKIGGTPLTDL